MPVTDSSATVKVRIQEESVHVESFGKCQDSDGKDLEDDKVRSDVGVESHFSDDEEEELLSMNLESEFSVQLSSLQMRLFAWQICYEVSAWPIPES